MFDARVVADAWKRALDVWGLVVIAVPRQDSKADALAFIEMNTRQVVINPDRIAAIDSESSLEAIFAHELGHHLRYPGSLSVQARLEMMERELLPIRGYSLLNLFTDFLINTDLAREKPHLQPQLEKIYRGCRTNAGSAKQDPCFCFYLMCFEEAWMLPKYSLSGEAGHVIEENFAGARAEAQLVAQELPNLAPNLFTQLVFFASIFSRYQPYDETKAPSAQQGHGRELNPTAGDHSDPSAGDYADAMRRSSQESEAIRRAIKEGWLKPAQIPDGDASERTRAASLPGVLAGAPKKLAEAMAIHYRRLAEKYLFKPPKERRGGEPLIPSTLSPWDMGDSPKEIDWIATITASGADLGLASPLKRDLLEDEPDDKPVDWTKRLEIYLDVSGSMPDPKASVNPMTLAAQVLAMSALRNGGQVRALIYSTNNLQHWEWTRSEMEMSRFLMNYIGGGTDFPFDILRDSVRDSGANQPIRVVLTDSDFHGNLHGTGHADGARAAAAAGTFVALLNGATGQDLAWVKTIAATGIRAIPVPDMSGFPQTAAALGEALFGNSGPAPRRVAPPSAPAKKSASTKAKKP